MINAVASGKAIKKKMQENKITVRALSRKLDVSEYSVYCWRCGNRLPSIDHLVEMKELFNCKLDDLVVEG